MERVRIETENLGVHFPDYFRGVGADGADEHAIGIGRSEKEAAEDALEQLASSADESISSAVRDFSTDTLSDSTEEIDALEAEERCEPRGESPWVYVVVRAYREEEDGAR